MARRYQCSVCLSESRGLIDEKLAAKVPLRQISERFGVGRMALLRHSKHEHDRAAELARQRVEQEAAELKRHQETQAVEKTLHPQPVALAKRSEYVNIPALSRELTGPEELKLLQSLINEKIPRSLIVERLLDSVNAKRFRFFSANGRCTDVKASPDYAERRAGLELLFKILGYLPTQNTVSATVEIDARPLESVLDEMRSLTDELAIELERSQSQGPRDPRPIVDLKPES